MIQKKGNPNVDTRIWNHAISYIYESYKMGPHHTKIVIYQMAYSMKLFAMHALEKGI